MQCHKFRAQFLSFTCWRGKASCISSTYNSGNFHLCAVPSSTVGWGLDVSNKYSSALSLNLQYITTWHYFWSPLILLFRTCIALLCCKKLHLLIVGRQFWNQPPIGWLKKYKIENKTLLYGTVTHITAVLLHIVAIHIWALVPWH
jgi:hypothetical protein